MALTAFPVVGKQKAVDLCNAFIAGAPKSAVGHVFFGVNASNKRYFDLARQGGRDWYYIDNAYFDGLRGVQFRITRNAVQHTGRGVTDGKRFNAMGIKILPWTQGEQFPDAHIVVCPQSDDFMRNVAGYPGNWLEDTKRRLGELFPFRPLRIRLWNSDKAKLAATLEADLIGAYLLATYSSAAAVTATLMGVPVSTDSSCAAYTADVTGRRRWAGVLADNQFTVDEMRSGFAWEQVQRAPPTRAGLTPPEGRGLDA